MSKLILLRHGESAWNKKNLFTGWVNIGLSSQGINEALAAGNILNETKIDIVYTSSLIRSQQTAMISLANYHKNAVLINQYSANREWQETDRESLLPVYEDWRLNERFYGELQGLNKKETVDKYGAEQVHIWRRSYNEPPPNGESLEMTSERALPAFHENIKPALEANNNVLVVAHGNSLRSLIMTIENLNSSEITKYEIPTGKPLYYEFINDSFNLVAT